MPGDDYKSAELTGTPIENSPASVTGELTIDEAKRGLAKKFGVSAEQIEITIRG
ncbi:hypothetical protein D3C85_1882150 [compost metagenome]